MQIPVGIPNKKLPLERWKHRFELLRETCEHVKII
jgi:hypothetical protein